MYVNWAVRKPLIDHRMVLDPDCLFLSFSLPNHRMADLPSVSEPNPPPQLASSQPQSVRIQFPDRFLTTRTHGDSSRSSSANFASPVQPMPQSWSDSRVSTDLTEGRRRVRSLGPDPMVSGSKMESNTLPRHYGSRRRKNLNQSLGSALKPLRADPFMPDFEPSAFSDEYDLCEFSVTSCLQPLNSWTAS